MSGVNPVVLIQLMTDYHQKKKSRMQKEPRTFTFNRNNLIRVHKETAEELSHRKSWLSPTMCDTAETTLKDQLAKVLKGRIGRVWIDPNFPKVAAPISMSTGETGFGLLPTGSRIKIPEGKKIRAFTYWEKVNDIDLSCFGLNANGKQEEFSWRNMAYQQGEDITFSGDETSGYRGGSEFFDIDLDKFQANHPQTRYIVFCNNVYSGKEFRECFCKAGFMMRDIHDSGQVYEPKTVDTSYQITCDSTFAYLFAIDLREREMIWLNVSRNGHSRVAGTTSMGWLEKYFVATEAVDVAELYRMAGTPVQSMHDDWEIALSDRALDPLILRDREQIHSYDFEKVLKLLQAG